MLSDYATLTGAPTAADQAAGLAPSDPEAHFARAVVYQNASAPEDAIREYERAAQLRPRDYYLWLMLADARDQSGDSEGALAACAEAVRLAPFYARPRWEYGNLLFRAGRLDEAFAELRRAAESNPALLPSVIDLAWGSSNRDPQAVERIIQPRTDAAHLALARFYAKHERAAEAVSHLRAAGEVSAKERAAMLNDLLAAKRFKEAYDVWYIGHQEQAGSNSQGYNSLVDGGFEKNISLDDPGFGWQFTREVPVVSFAADRSERHEGARSLRVDWKGDYNPAKPLLWQLILVEPKTRYRLHFAARSQELVTGGLPFVVVNDADAKAGEHLAQSKTLPSGTGPWSDYTVEFITGNETAALYLGLQRQNCGAAQCPIFGRTWLDDFSLQKI